MGIAAKKINGGTTTLTAEVFFNLYTTLKEGGWRPVADSDGTTRSGTGNQLTHFGSGANGFGNNNAWWILRQPIGGIAPYSGNRTITVRRNSPDNYTVWYSFSGNLTTIGNATTPDSAADTQVVAGPFSFNILIYYAFVHHIIVTDAAENFGWWLILMNISDDHHNISYHLNFNFDPMYDRVIGDQDPYVIRVNQGYGMEIATMAGAASGVRGWFDIGGPYQVFGLIRGCSYGFHNTQVWYYVRDLGQVMQGPNYPFITMPIIYCRKTADGNGGYKGTSTLFRVRCTGATHGTLVNLTGPRSHIIFQDFVVRWDGESSPAMI